MFQMYERGGNHILGEEQHVYTFCASDKHIIYEDPKGKLPVGASGAHGEEQLGRQVLQGLEHQAETLYLIKYNNLPTSE